MARFFSLAERTIHTEPLVPYTKTQKYAAKMYRTKLYLNKLFHYFLNVFRQNKSDLISKSFFFSLDYGHKSQSGVLA